MPQQILTHRSEPSQPPIDDFLGTFAPFCHLVCVAAPSHSVQSSTLHGFLPRGAFTMSPSSICATETAGMLPFETSCLLCVPIRNRQSTPSADGAWFHCGLRLTDECVDGLRFEASSILANSGTAESVREFRNRYRPSAAIAHVS